MGRVSLVLSVIASEILASGLTGSRPKRRTGTYGHDGAVERDVHDIQAIDRRQGGSRWDSAWICDGIMYEVARYRWSVGADVEQIAADITRQCFSARLGSYDEHRAAGDIQTALEDAGERVATIGRIARSPGHGYPSRGFGVLSVVKK